MRRRVVACTVAGACKAFAKRVGIASPSQTPEPTTSRAARRSRTVGWRRARTWYFPLSTSDGGALLLVAGGSGIVPLRSMIRHHAAQRGSEPLLLLFSAPTWDEVIFRDESLAYEAERRGLDVVLTLTPEAARRTGDFARRVDDAMLAALLARLAGAPKLCSVCGSNPPVFVLESVGVKRRAEPSCAMNR